MKYELLKTKNHKCLNIYLDDGRRKTIRQDNIGVFSYIKKKNKNGRWVIDEELVLGQ